MTAITDTTVVTGTKTARAQRRAARQERVQHLITADEHSLAELQAVLSTLPLCAAGRVFIETPDSDAIVPIDVPARMTVTWLPRSRRSGAPGTGEACSRGTAVARAACAWADEMLCDEVAVRASITLLGGYLGTADIVEHLTERVGVAPGNIHAPERFGLLSHS